MIPYELADWRMRRWLSQPALARLLGVTTNTVNRWERGHNAIPPFLQLALAYLDLREKWQPSPSAPPDALPRDSERIYAPGELRVIRKLPVPHAQPRKS